MFDSEVATCTPAEQQGERTRLSNRSSATSAIHGITVHAPTLVVLYQPRIDARTVDSLDDELCEQSLINVFMNLSTVHFSYAHMYFIAQWNL